MTPEESRPFAQTVSVDRHASIDSIETIAQELRDAVLAGDGLVVVTGGPGLGKSHHAALLCHRVVEGLTPILLPTGGITTRRGIYQQALDVLGRTYAGLSEEECRLSLLAAAREAVEEGRPVLLVVDEAHLCSDRALEEFRALHNFVRNGVPLVRTALFGSCELEDRLAAGRLDAVNQRISCLSTLPPLSEREAALYIGGRLEAAGLSADDVFSTEAVSEICRAADGSPRAINYLADRTMRLASGVATVNDVTAALSRLTSLSIAWRMPLDVDADLEGILSELNASVDLSAPDDLEPLDGAVVEVGAINGKAAGLPSCTNQLPDAWPDLLRLEREFVEGLPEDEFSPTSTGAIDAAFGEDEQSEAEPTVDPVTASEMAGPDFPTLDGPADDGRVEDCEPESSEPEYAEPKNDGLAVREPAACEREIGEAVPSERETAPVSSQPSLEEWDDVLPLLPSEMSYGTHVVGTPWSDGEGSAASAKRALAPLEDEDLDSWATLLSPKPLSEQDDPDVETDGPSDIDDAPERAVSVAALELAATVRDAISAEDAGRTVSAVGPKWPVERPAPILPPGPADLNTHADLDDHDDVEADAPTANPAEGLFTRLRRRQSSL